MAGKRGDSLKRYKELQEMKKRLNANWTTDTTPQAKAEEQRLFEEQQNRKPSLGAVKRNGMTELKNNRPLQPGHSWTPSVFGGLDGEENRKKLKNAKRKTK